MYLMGAIYKGSVEPSNPRGIQSLGEKSIFRVIPQRVRRFSIDLQAGTVAVSPTIGPVVSRPYNKACGLTSTAETQIAGAAASKVQQSAAEVEADSPYPRPVRL